jgi:hypothetical protein
LSFQLRKTMAACLELFIDTRPKALVEGAKR